VFDFGFDFYHLLGLEHNVISSIKTLFLIEISFQNVDIGF